MRGGPDCSVKTRLVPVMDALHARRVLADVGIDDPALYAAFALRDALTQRGIAVHGDARALHRLPGDGPYLPPAGFELARRESAPLVDRLAYARDVVRAEAGGVDLDTLFIDEGFGSLDAETLDLVMAVIDDLRDGGRAIGIVSHVTDLKDQITERLEIRRTDPQGPSTTRVVA